LGRPATNSQENLCLFTRRYYLGKKLDQRRSRPRGMLQAQGASGQVVKARKQDLADALILKTHFIFRTTARASSEPPPAVMIKSSSLCTEGKD